MKERLTTLFNVMQRVETHGDSTLMMADCIRELADIINSLPKESEAKNE